MADILSSLVGTAASAANPVSAIANVVGGIIDRIWPDPTINAQMKADLAKAQMNGDLQKALDDNSILKAQIAVNQAEASSGNAYAADARPTVMYAMCALLVWTIGAAPFVAWAVHIFAPNAPALPVLDISTVSTVMFGLLGLGGMHTYENVKGNGAS